MSVSHPPTPTPPENQNTDHRNNHKFPKQSPLFTHSFLKRTIATKSYSMAAASARSAAGPRSSTRS